MLVPLLLQARAPPPPVGTPTTPVLATLSPLLGAPAFLRLHVKLKHESTALMLTRRPGSVRTCVCVSLHA